MTKFEQIFLQNWDIKISGKNVQISLQEYLKLNYLSLKNAWLPTIFSLDSDSPGQDLLFLHSHKPHKNTLRNPNVSDQTSDVQNVCPVTKGGTVLKFD